MTHVVLWVPPAWLAWVFLLLGIFGNAAWVHFTGMVSAAKTPLEFWWYVLVVMLINCFTLTMPMLTWRVLPVASTGVISFTFSVIGTFLIGLYRGEQADWTAWLGIFLIVAGVLLVNNGVTSGGIKP